jgi:cytochrome c-type biogenesis protein CcmH
MTALFKFLAVAITGLALLLPLLSPVSVSLAQSTIDQPLANPADEKRALALHKLLRCLVCQNQSISDSNAELARDLRILVRQRIGAGDSDDETMAYIVDRYGDWVLLDPPVKATTYALWFGPIVIFVLALIGVIGFLRRSRSLPSKAVASLNAEEEARLKTLLDENGDTR